MQRSTLWSQAALNIVFKINHARGLHVPLRVAKEVRSRNQALRLQRDQLSRAWTDSESESPIQTLSALFERDTKRL